jgi:hypothetical protein
MLRCKIKSCQSWCHTSCIRSCKDLKYKLFAPAAGLNDSLFICPNCVDQPKECVSQAIAEVVSIIDRLKKREDSDEDGSPEPYIQEEPFLQKNENQQRIPQQDEEYLSLMEARASDYELARDEKFQGFLKDEVDGLIHKLDQSIYDYNKEVVETMERFGDGDDAYIKKPLADWKLVDADESIKAGQPWYCISWHLIECPTKNLSRSHLPITAALRTMLNLIGDKPLEIDPDLRSLTFSQVHTGFVGWFVIDVLSNELDIYGLPNMIPMRAMMAAVKDFAEASKYTFLILHMSWLTT